MVIFVVESNIFIQTHQKCTPKPFIKIRNSLLWNCTKNKSFLCNIEQQLGQSGAAKKRQFFTSMYLSVIESHWKLYSQYLPKYGQVYKWCTLTFLSSDNDEYT